MRKMNTHKTHFEESYLAKDEENVTNKSNKTHYIFNVLKSLI